MSAENLKFGLKPKDGFYELPYVANSPESIVTSFDKMPFTKHSKKRKQLAIDTPFLTGKSRYANIENGLWVFYSEIEYKENINYKRIEINELPSNYYILSLQSSKDSIHKKKRSIVNGQSYSGQSWLLFKPKANNTDCNFKGSKQTSFNIYFNEKWLKKVLYKSNSFLKSNLKEFFDSKAQYIIWPDAENITRDLIYRVSLFFNNRSVPDDNFDKHLKMMVKEALSLFIQKYKLDNVGKKFYEIPSKERKEILGSEKILCSNLYAKFSGIETLSGTAGMSPTKFKRCFKLVYGMAPYQYFQAKQMVLAKEMLQKNNHKIGELAKLFQYENSGKFSSAFRKNFGHLPSEITTQ